MMLTDVEIAQSAVMEPIQNIAKKVGLKEDDLELYGKYKAKISLEAISQLKEKENGKQGDQRAWKNDDSVVGIVIDVTQPPKQLRRQKAEKVAGHKQGRGLEEEKCDSQQTSHQKGKGITPHTVKLYIEPKSKK